MALEARWDLEIGVLPLPMVCYDDAVDEKQTRIHFVVVKGSERRREMWEEKKRDV